MVMVKSAQRERFEEDTFPHLTALWRTALWLTMRRSFAEDLVLKTMTQAYRSWYNSVDTVGSKARLFRIMTTEFSDAGNRRHPPGRFLPKQCTADANIGAGSLQYPVASVDRRELLLLTRISGVSVRGSIARLRVQSRLVMILLFREGFSYADIAYITGLPKDSVRSILGRSRKLIPRCLLQHDDWFGTAANSRATFQVYRASSDDD